MALSQDELENIKKQLAELETYKADEIPCVSVIIPVYNMENFFSRCLMSLVKQTLNNIEIIIVDDGSCDDTKLIASLFIEHDPRIKLIEQEHKLQGAARNNGIQKARGEYIGFVDSDDWVDLDYFEKMYYAAKKYNSDIALAVNVRIGNGKSKKRIEIKEEKNIVDIQEKIDVCKMWRDGCPTNKIYKTEFLKSNNISYPEGVYCEDKLFTTKAVCLANSIVTVPDIFYYYYRNPKSTVKNTIKENKFKHDKNNARLEVLKFLKCNNIPVRDKNFWAVTKKISVFGIPIYLKRESLHTAKHYLLSFIKIWEEKI